MTTTDREAHLLDDLAKVKGYVHRTVNSEVDMLTISLQALRKGKTHVTFDHVERVIDNLNALLIKTNKINPRKDMS